MSEYDEVLQNARILIVEDDPDQCGMLDRLFSQKGFINVEIARNGRQAINQVLDAAAAENEYDLMVLDLMLPGRISGQEVYQRLSVPVDLPIVVMTSRPDKEAQIDALQYMDVEEYFIKPLDPELFLLKCERLLARRLYARRFSAGNRRSQKLFLNVLQVMAKVLEAKDSYTRFHSENVAKYARLIGRRMGFCGQKLELLQIAGILHDFGKIGIRESLLNKPGALTEKEYVAIQRHPLIASTLLEPIDELATVIQDIRHHHERYDGSGYPDRLVGEEIPLGARILAVADAFDAMTSKRAYHDPKTEEVAREEMERCAGSQFDPEIVKHLCDILDERASRRQQLSELRNDTE